MHSKNTHMCSVKGKKLWYRWKEYI